VIELKRGLYWMTITQLCELKFIVETLLVEKEGKESQELLEEAKIILDDISLGFEYESKPAEPLITSDDAFNSLARTLDRS